MIICLDGLSLERHISFVNKLCKLPMRFTDSYKQSLIFQKALSRVIEVSGPLHTAFHMLQVVYTVYKSVLQATQKCLGWKKINMSQVSETYRLCHSMISILYEELYRYLFLSFLEEYTNSNEEIEFTFDVNKD